MAKKSKQKKVDQVKKPIEPIEPIEEKKIKTETSYDESIAQRSKVEDQVSGRKVYESADQERIAQDKLVNNIEVKSE